ncbi:hypothetical protein Hanom_Chr11g01006591 [Helianthus anomalus]
MIKNQDLKAKLETYQNIVLEKNQLILDKDNLILDMEQKHEKFESSSDVMIFCINNLHLKDSEDEMFGVGYKKVPPPINHNYTSTPSIDPEIVDFVPTAPLTVDPLSKEESESESDQKRTSDVKTNEIDLSKIENLINSKILEVLNQVQNVQKPKSKTKGKKNVKKISKTNYVKGESFNKEGEMIEKGSNSEFVKQKAKGSNVASSSSNSQCEDDQKEKNEKIDKR